MPQANINERASVESIYSQDDFQRDAARNGVGDASILHGLTIASEPDGSGAFALKVSRKHAGERDPEGDAVFVPAFSKRGPEPQTSEAPSRDEEYGAFIDGVLALARSADFKPAVGRGDDRLKGFHGG